MGVLKNLNRTVALTGLFGVLLLSQPFANAASTVVEGPGFKYETKDGWFGTSKTTYTDAFGNKVEKKKGLFGGPKQDVTIMGNTVQKGNNINVTAPNGQPVIQQKKTLFGGQSTKVDINPIIEGIMELLNGTP